jgi:hypothetical protein
LRNRSSLARNLVAARQTWQKSGAMCAVHDMQSIDSQSGSLSVGASGLGAKAAIFCHVFASGAPGRTDGRSNGIDNVITYDRVGAADARHPAACPNMPGSDRTKLWPRGTARPGRVWLEVKVAPTA